MENKEILRSLGFYNKEIKGPFDAYDEWMALKRVIRNAEHEIGGDANNLGLKQIVEIAFGDDDELVEGPVKLVRFKVLVPGYTVDSYEYFNYELRRNQ